MFEGSIPSDIDVSLPGCICPIVPNIRGHRMVDICCPIHQNETNCIIVTAGSKFYMGRREMFGGDTDQRKEIKRWERWKKRIKNK